jgi:hypothetical protein
VGLVFLRDRKSLTSLGGARSRSNTAGGIDRMDCSNNRVKSKLERHPWMIGPNRSSFAGSQVAAIVVVTLGCEVENGCKVEDGSEVQNKWE